MAERRPPSIARKIASVAAVAVMVLAVAGAAFAYLAGNAGSGTFCTAAGSIGGPVTETPDAAFDAWWAEFRPDVAQADGDIDQDGTTWHVDKGTPDWVKVEVERAGHGLLPEDRAEGDRKGWTVVGANSCSAA